MTLPEHLADESHFNITLIYSPAPRHVREWRMTLAVGASVAQALAGCTFFNEFPDLLKNHLRLGIWGVKSGLDQQLADNDRVEIYRSLRVDPKVARRERFSRQGAKSAGLFVRVRPGGKAGY